MLRGNVQNNTANISRIQEELQGQEDRSGGIDTQIHQTAQRIDEIGTLLREKDTALDALGIRELTPDVLRLTGGFVLKNHEDMEILEEETGKPEQHCGSCQGHSHG